MLTTCRSWPTEELHLDKVSAWNSTDSRIILNGYSAKEHSSSETCKFNLFNEISLHIHALEYLQDFSRNPLAISLFFSFSFSFFLFLAVGGNFFFASLKSFHAVSSFSSSFALFLPRTLFSYSYQAPHPSLHCSYCSTFTISKLIQYYRSHNSFSLYRQTIAAMPKLRISQNALLFIHISEFVKWGEAKNEKKKRTRTMFCLRRKLNMFSNV